MADENEMTQNTPKKSDYIKTYLETKKTDIAGVVGGAGSTILGGVAGWLGATPIAGWFGANVITTSGLGTALNLLPVGVLKFAGITSVVTVTTPVTWVVGSVATCASIGFGIYKLAHSGGINDERRRKLGKELLIKLQKIREQKFITQSFDSENIAVNSSVKIEEISMLFHELSKKSETKFAKVITHVQNLKSEQLPIVVTLFHELAKEGGIKLEKVATYVENLKSGRLPIDVAINILNEHGKELVNPSLNPNADVDVELSKAASARAFTAMNKGVANTDEPSESFLNTMQNRFGVERGRAVELYRDAPLDPNPKETAQQLGQIFSSEVIGAAFEALADTAKSMQQGQAAFVRFLEVSAVLDGIFDETIGTMEKDISLHAAIGRL
ncbi:MAG: hypothetical protein WCL34_06820 [Methylococcaceae bacterium]